MYRTVLQIKLNDAKDPNNPRYYSKRAHFVLPPLPGTKVRIGKRSILVVNYSQEPGTASSCEDPIVELEKQNQTYRGASFENLCKSFEDAGFKQALDKLPEEA